MSEQIARTWAITDNESERTRPMPIGPRPFIPAPGVAQLNAFYECAGQVCQNVYHFYKGSTSAWTGAQLVTLKGMFDAWETAYGRDLRTLNTALHRVRILDLTAEGGAVLDQASSIEGTHAGDIYAQSNTIAIKANTGFSGRSKRGRTYWIGLPSTFLSDGEVSTGFIDAAIIAMNALIAAAETATTPLVITSFQSGDAWRSTAVSTIVQDYSVSDTYADSQRRRLPGH